MLLLDLVAPIMFPPRISASVASPRPRASCLPSAPTHGAWGLLPQRPAPKPPPPPLAAGACPASSGPLPPPPLVRLGPHPLPEVRRRSLGGRQLQAQRRRRQWRWRWRREQRPGPRPELIPLGLVGLVHLRGRRQRRRWVSSLFRIAAAAPSVVQGSGRRRTASLQGSAAGQPLRSESSRPVRYLSATSGIWRRPLHLLGLLEPVAALAALGILLPQPGCRRWWQCPGRVRPNVRGARRPFVFVHFREASLGVLRPAAGLWIPTLHWPGRIEIRRLGLQQRGRFDLVGIVGGRRHEAPPAQSPACSAEAVACPPAFFVINYCRWGRGIRLGSSRTASLEA